MSRVQVFHMEKRITIAGGLNRHITRVQWVGGKLEVWVPKNANPELTKNNVELVSLEFANSDGKLRTLSLQEAINKRIAEANIKPRKGQARSLEIIFSGSPEIMNKMSREEILEWAKDTLEWAQKTWGKENVVSASLHLDEKTPHIHMIVVPIVKGQSRRTKAQNDLDKERGTEKSSYKIDHNKLRLCSNEVFTTPLLYNYHDQYALEVSNKYGLERGLRAEPGSHKKHQTSEDYNRQLAAEAAEKRSLIAEIQSDYTSSLKKKKDAERKQQEAETKQKEAEDKKTLLEQQITEKETEVNELKKKSSSLSREITANEEKISELQATIKANEETICDQDDQLTYNGQKMEVYKEINKAIEARKNELRSISSIGTIQSIQDMMKAEVQQKMKGYWKGKVQSFEKVQYSINDGEPEDFIKVNMKTEETDYYIEVRLATSKVYLDGDNNNFKWPNSGKDMIMPELASYFTAKVTEETNQFVESLFEAPANTEEVVWECDLGLDKTRIIHREDGKYELQRQKYNTQGKKYHWEKITACKLFKELGRDETYAYLKISHSNGVVEYINQYGNFLNNRQLEQLGKSTGNGMSM